MASFLGHEVTCGEPYPVIQCTTWGINNAGHSDDVPKDGVGIVPFEIQIFKSTIVLNVVFRYECHSVLRTLLPRSP
jgi:hypothetical protein